MKWPIDKHIRKTSDRRSRLGAWIEIGQPGRTVHIEIRRSRLGAWIEINDTYNANQFMK